MRKTKNRSKLRRCKTVGGNPTCTHTIDIMYDPTLGYSRVVCPICKINIVVGDKLDTSFKKNVPSKFEEHLNEQHPIECCLCPSNAFTFCIGTSTIYSRPKFNNINELLTHFRETNDATHRIMSEKKGMRSIYDINRICSEVKNEALIADFEFSNSKQKTIAKTKTKTKQKTKKISPKKKNEFLLPLPEPVEPIIPAVKPEPIIPVFEPEPEPIIPVEPIIPAVEPEPENEYIPWIPNHRVQLDYEQEEFHQFWAPLFNPETDELEKLKTYLNEKSAQLCGIIKTLVPAYEIKDREIYSEPEIAYQERQKLLCILFYFIGILGAKMSRNPDYQILLKGGKVGQLFMSKKHIQERQGIIKFKPSDDIDIHIVPKKEVNQLEHRYTIAIQFVKLFYWILEGSFLQHRLSILFPNDVKAVNPYLIKMSYLSPLGGFTAICDINFQSIEPFLLEYYKKSSITSHEFKEKGNIILRYDTQSLTSTIKEKIEYLLIYFEFEARGKYITNPEYQNKVVKEMFEKMLKIHYENQLKMRKGNKRFQNETDYRNYLITENYGKNNNQIVDEIINREKTALIGQMLTFLSESVLPKFKDQILRLLPLVEKNNLLGLLMETNSPEKQINANHFMKHFERL